MTIVRTLVSVRRCFAAERLRATLKEPDPTAEKPETWRKLLAIADAQLESAKLKGLSCADTMVKGAQPCLRSIHGMTGRLVGCAASDLFLRKLRVADFTLKLGVGFQ